MSTRDDALRRLTRSTRSDSNAILAFDEEVVRAQPARTGPLSGRLVAIKDNICTTDYPTSCGSRILEGYRSPFDAFAVRRIKQCGGVVACKTNLDEFGMGSSTEHSAFGRSLHPLDPALVPGGSSGGSAVVVADGTVPFAIGSETGGSVRQPASFCGIVGIKPTYGRVSRYGLVAFGSSLDQIGVFGRDVTDAALLLSCIAGHDPADSTSLDTPGVPGGIQPLDLEGLTVGLPQEYYPENLDPGTRAACATAVAHLREAGATIMEISLPTTDCAVAAYYVIAPAEASSNLARFDGVRFGLRQSGDHADVTAMYRATRGAGFGTEVKRRIIIGTYVLSAGYYDAFYGKAQRTRAVIAAEFDSVFANGVDLLFTPTTAGPAFKAGSYRDDPLQMYLADRFVCPVNLAGLPAMSIPIGRSEGLPLGGQFIAPALGEEKMVGAAMALETLVDPTGEVR